MPVRYNYVIGDLQGCFAATQALLKEINFDEKQDHLWFAGDLVARGEDSLATLRLVKQLCESGVAHTVLGNHDLNLLAVWRGFNKLKKNDRTAPIFDAPDAVVLLNWLRKQPLLLRPNPDYVLTHAGLPPTWTTEQAEHLAFEVALVLRGTFLELDRYLAHMFGNQPDQWSDELTGVERLRVITNYFTRMRLIDGDGRLELDFKEGLDAPMPKGFSPWFTWPTVVPRTEKVLFGHWAALEGAAPLSRMVALDGGCVWGGSLIAYRLEDGQRFETRSGCGLG
ncbi:symmetrical bis(5'-nucleosyl)-tetraphosphatase [Aquirhabdus parva]|uniref:bis(5'-nucleosyl)-tetraphosphatase (symmetrical) n=1 Tax=Aquirhabdus parva TaxID=2283318 RepID=A0A345P3F3_9GAMM|nr:symmetrical bis(5'-nucleosyl)-tetraphosphatase [Aquirhabdus parva]AXI01812.1 symmetrical bis(5'-nucleosyl)-tetraphosphatase [Aquirhabdus parva]